MGQTVASGSGQGGGTVASGNHVVRGIVFAALGGICWGFSGTCAQLMTSGFGVPVSWITCVR
ncbi:MAG: GNAT family N-acetyltransferase, partial [Eggerthella lenta]